ncbi:unnamed protein product [Amoebophrya sp. A25]|nr:unnamed protein product [Amoebophrya sp. A25]|eukprot:GSA25T00011837001.1
MHEVGVILRTMEEVLALCSTAAWLDFSTMRLVYLLSPSL